MTQFLVLVFNLVTLASAETNVSCSPEVMASVKDASQMVLCLQSSPESTPVVVRRINEDRLDLELLAKGVNAIATLDSFKSVGDSILKISHEGKEHEYLELDLNQDGTKERLLRFRFHRGAALFVLKESSAQLVFADVYPTLEKTVEPVSFLIHSDTSPLTVSNNGEMKAIVEQTHLDQTVPFEATYRVRKDGSVYLWKLKKLKK